MMLFLFAHIWEGRLLGVFQWLEKTNTGRTELKKLMDFYQVTTHQALLKYVYLGEHSKTDYVHIRERVKDHTQYRTETWITLRGDQNLEYIALDLAHEITHATEKTPYDPYDPDLSLGQFMRHALEGSAGEVRAVLKECELVQEAFQKNLLSSNRCVKYLTQDKIDVKKVKQAFYKVGPYRKDILKALKGESTLFPELSEDQPDLISGTGKAPYPYTLIQDYDQLSKQACINVVKRNRMPASEKEIFIKKRCKM